MVVVAGDDVALADLLGPPAQLGHAVLDGADGQALGLPARHEAFHVLWFQAGGSQMPKARLLELVGHEVEHTRAVALRGEAAVAVASAELLELVVQVAHPVAAGVLRCRVGRLPLGGAVGFVVAGVKSVW